MLSRIAASASLRRRGTNPAAAAAALSSALDVLPPLQWERLFSSSSSSSSSETPSGGDGQEPSTSSAPADKPPETKQTKRQRIRKPPRAVAGSWETCAELDDFLTGDAAHRVPAGANLYDLRSTFPYHFDDSRRNAPLFRAVAEAAAESGVDLDAADDDEEEEFRGKKRIVEWETNAVLETVAAEVGGGGGGGGGGFNSAHREHPINRKVALRVHLAELAEETGMSDDAARWVALVAGPRYDPRSGKIRLTDERHATRAENARSCARMLSALVAEGKRKHPS